MHGGTPHIDSEEWGLGGELPPLAPFFFAQSFSRLSFEGMGKKKNGPAKLVP